MQNNADTAWQPNPEFDKAATQADIASLSVRLWRKDTALWSTDAAVQAKIEHRLGWLDSASWLHEKLPTLKRLANDVEADGLMNIVLLGMGGSSLAPEVINAVAGGRRLTVLDNTSVAAVRRVRETFDPASTVYVVSSKSGGTIETMAFAHYFLQQVDQLTDNDQAKTGAHFIAITDPGSPLGQFAKDRQFRHVFENPADIGGRYSALSYFGAVPCALAGIDLDAQLSIARDRQSDAATGASLFGARLGHALGHFAARGRDKLTLGFSDALAPMGAWIEQLVAESTGKDGKGIVPVIANHLSEAHGYGDDRVFVYTTTASEGVPEQTVAQLTDAGHPVLVWTLPDRDHLGSAFLDWEIATAVSAIELDVNPFDEPNVTESKRATEAVLKARASNNQSDSTALSIQALDPVRNALEQTLATVKAGDYIGLLVYLDVDDASQILLDSISQSLAVKTRVPVTIGIGPRFLHSTGQLHKGGANNGVFIQMFLSAQDDIAIPTMDFGFATLNSAQARGDLDVLQKRERRSCAIDLGDNAQAGLSKVAALLKDLG